MLEAVPNRGRGDPCLDVRRLRHAIVGPFSAVLGATSLAYELQATTGRAGDDLTDVGIGTMALPIFRIGARSFVAEGVEFDVSRGPVLIGDDVTIGPRTRLEGPLIIESRVRIACDVSIGTSAFGRSAGNLGSVIVIGEDVRVGTGTAIRPGVRIGARALISARAVVASCIPPNAVAGGHPAILERWRGD